MKPVYYLLIGIITVTAAHLTISIDLAGWIAYAPFLLYLRNTHGRKSRLLFLAGLIIAWSFCIAKILSPPMPFVMIFLYSVPISLIHLPGFLIWDRFKDRKYAILLFPSLMILLEWIQYSFTPFASWGVAAYTQSHNIYLMQSLSLFGMPGLSFLVYWINICIAEIAFSKKTSRLQLQIPGIIICLLFIFGGLRYELNKAHGKEMIKVAAVGSDSDVTGFPLPSKEINDKVKEDLFSNTIFAAESGAKLIVWNEASTFIMPEEENTWRDSLSALAKKTGVPIVAAFIVPVSETPMRYKNNYLFYDAGGNLLFTYNKHQPVPGEPAVKGKENLQVFDIDGVTTGAVICYDYDFPYLAKGYGALNADLVADPSSDWRGIDPLHTRMAAYRAVEQGHSILRSTRFGLSAAITPYGEFSAQMSSYDKNDKVMMAFLPVQGVKTIYSVIGDTFVYLCILFILFFLFTGLRPVKK